MYKSRKEDFATHQSTFNRLLKIIKEMKIFLLFSLLLPLTFAAPPFPFDLSSFFETGVNTLGNLTQIGVSTFDGLATTGVKTIDGLTQTGVNTLGSLASNTVGALSQSRINPFGGSTKIESKTAEIEPKNETPAVGSENQDKLLQQILLGILSSAGQGTKSSN